MYADFKNDNKLKWWEKLIIAMIIILILLIIFLIFNEKIVEAFKELKYWYDKS